MKIKYTKSASSTFFHSDAARNYWFVSFDKYRANGLAQCRYFDIRIKKKSLLNNRKNRTTLIVFVCCGTNVQLKLVICCTFTPFCCFYLFSVVICLSTISNYPLHNLVREPIQDRFRWDFIAKAI